MQHSLTLTLAAWSDWIWIALVGATVIGSWIGNIKKQQQELRRRDEGSGALELDELAARRREQLRQVSHQRVQASRTAGASGVSGVSGGGGEPGNMTMAERIARARAKAQYEQRTQGAGRLTQVPQPQIPNEAQRRALAQRQAELDHRRQATAQAQQQAQQQAQRRARLQAQQRARQQRAQVHAQAQTRARQRGKLMHAPVLVPEPTTSTIRRLVPDKPARRQKPTPQPTPAIESVGVNLRGPLSRDELRRAIVLKELLDKPLALRRMESW